MGDSCTQREYGHADDARNDNTDAAMMAKPQTQRDDTQRQDHDQHLRVQVARRELREKRQTGDEHRQRQTVNETEGGQANRCAIEPVGRFRHALIRGELPLS